MLSPFESQEALTPLPDISEVVPLSGSDLPMVEEIAAVLRKYGALSRFGLTLLHQHFDIGDGEALVESTDVGLRTQTIKPTSKCEIEGLPVIETAWRLDTGSPVMACLCVLFGKDHMHVPRG